MYRAWSYTALQIPKTLPEVGAWPFQRVRGNFLAVAHLIIVCMESHCPYEVPLSTGQRNTNPVPINIPVSVCWVTPKALPPGVTPRSLEEISLSEEEQVWLLPTLPQVFQQDLVSAT